MSERNLEAEELAFLQNSVKGAGPNPDPQKMAEVQARMAELRNSGGAGYKGEAAQMRKDMNLKYPSMAELMANVMASRRAKQVPGGAMPGAMAMMGKR